MSKLYIVSVENYNALNGAAKFVKNLGLSTEFWIRNNVEVRIFSNSKSFQDEGKYKKSWVYKIKALIKKYISKTMFGYRIRFFKYELGYLGRKPIDELKQYLSLDASILLNDFLVAYNFYNEFGNNYNTIFMMHNNGELFSMLAPYMRDPKIDIFLKDVEKQIFKCATKIVFVSETARNTFLLRYPEYEKKTLTIYNGLQEPSQLVIHRNDCLRMVTVGTLCDSKNLIDIINDVIVIGIHDIELTVVGDGPAFSKCKMLVERNGFVGQIHLVGAQSDVSNYLEEANLFIMASKDEGLPIAAQEAMGAGLPIVLTDVGGCKDLISDNGILIKPTFDELKNAIKYVNNNKKLLQKWGNNSRKYFLNNFTITTMHENYLRLIKKMELEENKNT